MLTITLCNCRIIHCAVSFQQQVTVANLHKRSMPTMAVGFKVFSKVPLRVMDFLAEFYIGLQPP